MAARSWEEKSKIQNRKSKIESLLRLPDADAGEHPGAEVLELEEVGVVGVGLVEVEAFQSGTIYRTNTSECCKTNRR